MGNLFILIQKDTDLTAANSGDIVIGNAGTTTDTYSFTGHISNLSIIKNKALYTKNFKPSMRELEVTPETVLLACQSKTDASLEKTGKTITVTGNAVASELTPGILTPVPGLVLVVQSLGLLSLMELRLLRTLHKLSFDFGTSDFTIRMLGSSKYLCQLWCNMVLRIRSWKHCNILL